MEERKKRRHPIRNGFLICLLLILVTLGGLIWWQRENLVALQQGLQYTQEELEEQVEKNKAAIEEAMAQVPEIDVRPMTDEEKQALLNGTQDADSIAEQIVNKPKPAPKPMPDSKADKEVAPDTAEQVYEKELNSIMARLYVLKEEYLVKLAALETQAKEEYYAIPESKRTKKALFNLGTKYIAEGTRLESECDKKVLGIVAEVEKLLRKHQKDLGLVDTVIDTYAEEKRLKKAWYLSEIKGKGLM